MSNVILTIRAVIDTDADPNQLAKEMLEEFVAHTNSQEFLESGLSYTILKPIGVTVDPVGD